MAKRGKDDTAIDQGAVAPRCLAIAEKGVRTGEDFANLMSALMSDVIEGRMAPNVANATCNAGGKLLKVIEMEHKYGRNPQPADKPAPRLRLAS